MSTSSRLLRASALIGLITLSIGYTSIVDAAQGCGYGYHRGPYGGCVLNRPGPGATPAPAHPGCWRNANGYLRCYR
jgi:hypothetical protein